MVALAAGWGMFREPPATFRIFLHDTRDTRVRVRKTGKAATMSLPLSSVRAARERVYRVTDSKLYRDVALKILPEVFAVHPARLEAMR